MLPMCSCLFEARQARSKYKEIPRTVLLIQTIKTNKNKVHSIQKKGKANSTREQNISKIVKGDISYGKNVLVGIHRQPSNYAKHVDIIVAVIPRQNL